jgi:hypothetical protein
VSDTGAGRAQLLADAPVDAPTEQIGVPVKARVLLDHVHQQLAQPDRLTLGVAAREAEIVITGELFREGDLLPPAAYASATTAGSATAPLKSASGRRRSDSASGRQVRTSRVPPRPCAGPGRAGTLWTVARPGGPVGRRRTRRISAAASSAGSAETQSAWSARRLAAGRLGAGRSRDRGTGPPDAAGSSRRPRLPEGPRCPKGRNGARLGHPR